MNSEEGQQLCWVEAHQITPKDNIRVSLNLLRGNFTCEKVEKDMEVFSSQISLPGKMGAQKVMLECRDLHSQERRIIFLRSLEKVQIIRSVSREE